MLSEVDELAALMISERIRQRITELEVASRDRGPAGADEPVLLDRGGLLPRPRFGHRVAAARRRRRALRRQAGRPQPGRVSSSAA